MKKILILGSTGSIGTNALELIRNNREHYQVIGISGNKNIELLKKQIEEFKPTSIYVGVEQDALNLKKEYPFIKEPSVYRETEGLSITGRNQLSLCYLLMRQPDQSGTTRFQPLAEQPARCQMTTMR